MNYMIIGEGRHGKTDLAEALSEKLGLKAKDSSLVMIEEFLPLLKSIFGDWSPKALHANRHSHFSSDFGDSLKSHKGNVRNVLYESMRLAETMDPLYIVSKIFDQADIYAGCRSKVAIEALKASDIPHMIIYVDAWDRVGKTEYGSTELDRDYCERSCHWRVDNNGSLEDFKGEIEDLTYYLEARAQCV